MELHVIDCLVTDYESIIDTLELPDPNDRHVLAAAIRANASLIVTFDLGDFPHDALSPYGIEAVSPDDFIVWLIESVPLKVVEAVRKRRLALRHPPKSADEYLETLVLQRLPNTTNLLSEHRDKI